MLPDALEDVARQLANYNKRLEHLERLEGVSGAWTLIQTVELTAPAVSIDFQNIPQTFVHLKAIGSTRDDRAGNNISDLGLRVNNLSTDIYFWLVDLIIHNNIEGTQQGLTDDQWKIGSHPALLAPANVFGPWEFLLSDYVDIGKKHSFISMTHHLSAFSDGNIWIRWGSGTVDDAAAINRLTFLSYQGANFIAGSLISLYGISG